MLMSSTAQPHRGAQTETLDNSRDLQFGAVFNSIN